MASIAQSTERQSMVRRVPSSNHGSGNHVNTFFIISIIFLLGNASVKNSRFI